MAIFVNKPEKEESSLNESSLERVFVGTAALREARCKRWWSAVVLLLLLAVASDAAAAAARPSYKDASPDISGAR